jgi:cysteine synthase
MSASEAPAVRPTPLLQWGRALLKLEMFHPAGSTSGRAAAELAWKGDAVIEASGNGALAAAARARALGAALTVKPRGVFTHEMREALKLWGARLDAAAVPTLPPLDSDAAVAAYARTLGEELLRDLTQAPPLVVAPAGDRAALLGALQALQAKWPRVRAVALVAGDDELPDLPRAADLPAGVERVPVTRARAAQARSLLSRELGLLAGHAGAAAAAYAAEHGGVALVTSPGEREFSLERPP